MVVYKIFLESTGNQRQGLAPSFTVSSPEYYAPICIHLALFISTPHYRKNATRLYAMRYLKQLYVKLPPHPPFSFSLEDLVNVMLPKRIRACQNADIHNHSS
jgi:hypothetical protein